MLLRFGRVYLGYITQADAGGAPADCYEPTVQVLLFPYTQTKRHRGVLYLPVVGDHPLIISQLLAENQLRDPSPYCSFLYAYRDGSINGFP